MRNRFVLVGPGAVGKVLARRLVKVGWRLELVVGHGSAEGKRFARAMKAPYSTDYEDIALPNGIILLTVPSKNIENVTLQLGKLTLNWQDIAVIHTSGLLDLQSLSLLKSKGCGLAACHPFMTFPRLKSDFKHESENPTVYGIDGNSKGLIAAKKMVKALSGSSIIVRGKDRIAYHGAAVIACTFLAANIKMAETILKKLKISDAMTKKAVHSIAKETLRNIEEFGVERALTGPAARKDRKTVKLQQSALKKLDPDIAKMYGELSEWVMKNRK